MVTERRFTTTEFEVRTSPSGDTTIEGHAAVFNRHSQNLGGFVEQVAPGAFTKTIQEADVRALFNHDPNMVLGRNKAGTLDLSEDNIGLAYRVTMPNTTFARDLAVSMQRGDISQSSFGFQTISDDWGFTDQDFPLRTLIECKLMDVSPVTYPAYLDADSGIASRAISRLAEKRSVSPEVAMANLKAVIRGDALNLNLNGDPVVPEGSADPGNDPGSTAQAVDASIDAAIAAFGAGDEESAYALLTAASISVDNLLDLLGVNDPGDDIGRSLVLKFAEYRKRGPLASTPGNGALLRQLFDKKTPAYLASFQGR